MLRPTMQSQQAGSRNDALTLALDRLRRALARDIAGREQEWAQTAAEALSGVEAALRQHTAAANRPDGALAEVDNTRPTLARQASALRDEYGALLKQVTMLKQEVQSAADLGLFRRHAEEFLTGLEQSKEAEASLVLESLNTDLGAGD